jgi:hypothetical protein
MRINDPRSKRAGLQGLALFGLGGDFKRSAQHWLRLSPKGRS